MRRILLTFMLFLGSLQAEERIFSLLPTLDTPLCVTPYIPSDFVAMTKSGKLSFDEWVYWGPKGVLEAYFEKPSSLNRSILRVRLSETVKQLSAEKFSAENDDMCKLMAPLGLKRLFDLRMKWGKYPIYVITAEFDNKWLYTAWVGLSDPQGTTLMFELVYPGTKPTPKDFELWDLFLDKTAIINGAAYNEGFQATFTQGATDVLLYGKAFSVIGEQRFSDKLIQIVIDTKKSGFKTILDTVHFAHIASEQGYSGAGAKVYLALVQDNAQRYTQMIPVVIKPVAEFSIDAEKAHARGDVVYEQKLPCMLKEYINY